MSLIRKLHNKEVTATVKEDGSAVTVGIDRDSALYVSREGKQGSTSERYYNCEDISLTQPGANAALYIAAKLWIESPRPWVIGGKPGDAWNCEVVSSGLNVIEYKHTSLIFLHPIENEVTKEISTPLTKMGFSKSMGIEIMVPTWFINNYDDLDVHFVKRHASVRFVWNAELPDVSHLIKLLDHTRCGFDRKREYSAAEILQRNASTVPIEDREAFTLLRDALATKLKMGLKYLESDPKLEREGIVIKDGENLVKVVNHLFVEANQYQHAVRNCIKNRTFSNDFAKYFPTCPQPLIDDIAKMWGVQAYGELSVVEKHMLRVMLYTMQDHYIRAQHQKKLSDPTGLYDNRYPSHAHQATLIAFHTAIESLNGF